MTDKRKATPKAQLKHLTGNLQQLAAVRSIILDEGPALGQRALAFSTGGGLDFWIFSDRTMDIGPLWFHGMPVAWHHPAGMLSPTLHDAHRDRETGIERALTGFMMTCGLDNVRNLRMVCRCMERCPLRQRVSPLMAKTGTRPLRSCLLKAPLSVRIWEGPVFHCCAGLRPPLVAPVWK